MKPTKKEQDETDEEKPTPTTTAIATPKKRRVVSFRDPATSDDEKNPKSSSLSSPTSIRSGTVQAVHDSSSSSSSTSRKRNRSSLSSSSVSKTRVKLPIFQSGWRSLRYPPAISAPGTKARFADLKARMQSVRSLKSLLVVPLEEDEEEKKAKVSSCVWTDGCGCQWSLLFFPLGNTSGKHVGLFLEKHTAHMERNVHVKFHLRRFDFDNQEEGAAHVCEFQHSYPAITDDDNEEKNGKKTQYWGLSEAHLQCDVLRRCINDDGFLDIDVYIKEIAPSSLLAALPSPRGQNLSSRLLSKSLQHSSNHPSPRLPSNLWSMW